MTTQPDRIAFLDHQRPSLTLGDYEVTVTQTIDLDPTPFTAVRTFNVSGDRFSLPSALLNSVFPVAGSIGDVSNVLPHAILGRPTLPWERRAAPTAPDLPWLALLVFDTGESPGPQVVALSDLASGPAHFPPMALEKGQQPTDRVSVIDVRRDVLVDLMPDAGTLRYLAHVRRGDGGDAAVVLAHRLPSPGLSSTVHLVSVEGRYTADGGSGSPAFDFGTEDPAGLVRLVSLASWQFASVDANQTFPHLVRRLADHGAPFRLPDTGNAAADGFLRQGFVPVPHLLRQGSRTVSWYRGPFATGPVEEPPAAGIRTSDELLRFFPDSAMFDVGYAAAWELGRLLALQSPSIAAGMFAWKRRRDQADKRSAQPAMTAFPLQIAPIDDQIPAQVTAWLADLAHLSGVPFKYLVPDERLLPVESIRFLQVDQQWARCLVDGAYSIGRLTSADAALDRANPLPTDFPVLTGALIRSDVVSGYPDLLVDGFSDAAGQTQLEQARIERLSSNVLLCLFKGVLSRLDVHQRPESLHHAVELPTDATCTKSLRALDASGSATVSTPPLPLGPRRTVPVPKLVGEMATALGVAATAFDAGSFARQMVETAERVTFLKA